MNKNWIPAFAGMTKNQMLQKTLVPFTFVPADKTGNHAPEGADFLFRHIGPLEHVADILHHGRAFFRWP